MDYKSYIKRIIAFVLLVCLCIPVVTACAKDKGSEPDSLENMPEIHFQGQTVAPTETPRELTTEEKIYEGFVDGFRDELFLISNDILEFGYNEASDVISSIERYVLKAELLPKLMDIASEAARETARECFPGKEIELETSFTLPEWQYLAAVLPFVETGRDLMGILGLTAETTDENGGILLSLSCAVKPIEEFAEQMSDSAEDETQKPNRYLDVRFTYAYLKAVYDEFGEERADFNTYSYPFEEKYIRKLTWPLSDTPWFSDTWAKPRSQNTRAHMGTDIRMAENSAIFSCSDGTVLYKGYADIPGNYVIVMDAQGFEYHYYHMSRLSDWVEPGDKVTSGQRIGDVGNTGNSDAPHLHISIISPEGVFVNPYELMQRLEEDAKGKG